LRLRDAEAGPEGTTILTAARNAVGLPTRLTNPLGASTTVEHAELLAKNLAREGRAKGPGQAAAHLAPSGMKRNKSAETRALLEMT
jgi:hypothetical protein